MSVVTLRIKTSPTRVETSAGCPFSPQPCRTCGIFGIRKQRVVGRVRPVHGDDVGQPPGPVDAVEIGSDPHAFGRVDIIGGMPDIGDGDVLRLGGNTSQADRHRARRRVGHGEALAAQWLLGGRWRRPANRGRQWRQQGIATWHDPSAATAAGDTVSPNFRAVMMTFAHSRTPDLLHLRAVMPYCEIQPGSPP